MIDLMDEENKICHSFMLTTRPIYVDRRQTWKRLLYMYVISVKTQQ
jgi:hypothetical protein